jgi:hypothetical protein
MEFRPAPSAFAHFSDADGSAPFSKPPAFSGLDDFTRTPHVSSPRCQLPIGCMAWSQELVRAFRVLRYAVMARSRLLAGVEFAPNQ